MQCSAGGSACVAVDFSCSTTRWPNSTPRLSTAPAHLECHLVVAHPARQLKHVDVVQAQVKQQVVHSDYAATAGTAGSAAAGGLWRLLLLLACLVLVLLLLLVACLVVLLLLLVAWRRLQGAVQRGRDVQQLREVLCIHGVEHALEALIVGGKAALHRQQLPRCMHRGTGSRSVSNAGGCYASPRAPQHAVAADHALAQPHL
jgi:hypothetical protein